jgi:hypothetical protein
VLPVGVAIDVQEDALAAAVAAELDRQRLRMDGGVVAGEVELGEPGVGEQHAVGVADGHLAAARLYRAGHSPGSLQEARMKYMILIHSNPASREIWESFSDAERAEGFRYYESITEEIAKTGELIVTEALADPATGKRVTVRDGATVTSDGPFAEAKEHLAGFYLVDCESIERAVEHASRMPEAEMGLVEVRPVLDLGGAEM